MTATDTSHKWQRWALKIRGYDFEVKYRAGKDNSNADGLTRLHYEGNNSMEANAPTELAAAIMLQLVADEIQAVPGLEEEDNVDVETVTEGEIS